MRKRTFRRLVGFSALLFAIASSRRRRRSQISRRGTRRKALAAARA